MAGLTLAFLLGASACGDDDGAGVREVGDGGSASGSASGSGSGSAASGSASGSAAEAACAPVGDLASADSTVTVELDEFTIEPIGTATAGAVGFELTNIGEEPHEMVVVAGDSIEALPTDADGALVEADLPDGSFIGEVEPFPGGEDCSGVFELAAGDYVLLCNIVEEEDGQTESHLAEGMATTFSVGE
jgi:hypothetical protein